MCSCGVEPETTLPYLLRCDLYPTYKLELLHDMYISSPSLENYSEDNLSNVPLYGEKAFTSRMNKKILMCAVSFSEKSVRFSDPLLC